MSENVIKKLKELNIYELFKVYIYILKYKK